MSINVLPIGYEYLKHIHHNSIPFKKPYLNFYKLIAISFDYVYDWTLKYYE